MNAVDLSPEAVARRRRAGGAGKTGAELLANAGRLLDYGDRRMRAADKYGRWSVKGRRQVRAAREALVNAAGQILVAELTPNDRPYLHHLTNQTITALEHRMKHRVRTIDGACRGDRYFEAVLVAVLFRGGQPCESPVPVPVNVAGLFAEGQIQLQPERIIAVALARGRQHETDARRERRPARTFHPYLIAVVQQRIPETARAVGAGPHERV